MTALRHHGALAAIATAPPIRRFEPGAGFRATAVLQRTDELAESFEQHQLFEVILDLLRTAGYEVAILADALALGEARAAAHPTDLTARRAAGMLERSVAFLGGNPGCDVTPTTRSTRHRALVAIHQEVPQ
jgi:hypothetical protein